MATLSSEPPLYILRSYSSAPYFFFDEVFSVTLPKFKILSSLAPDPQGASPLDKKDRIMVELFHPVKKCSIKPSNVCMK